MKKRKRKEPGLSALMLMGAGFSLAMIPILSFALALVSSFTEDPTALTGALSLVALLLAGAISGFVTSRVNGEGGALVGILSAVISAAAVLVIGLVIKGGRLNLSVFVNILAYICVSVLASVLGKRRIRKKHRRYA